MPEDDPLTLPEAAKRFKCSAESLRKAINRGGRHVELGMALALGLKVWVIGHRENIFCWLPEVSFFPSIDYATRLLRGTHDL